MFNCQPPCFARGGWTGVRSPAWYRMVVRPHPPAITGRPLPPPGPFFPPPYILQGASGGIVYVHVPAAWLGMGGWTGIAIASLVQIVWRHPLACIAVRAIAAPGALFTAICLVTGSIWGRPTWGTWWEWDGRMTSMLVLLFLYLGYIALANASSVNDAGGRGSVSRVTAIFGRSEEHTSELQSLMRISYAVFCLQQKNKMTRKHE